MASIRFGSSHVLNTSCISHVQFGKAGAGPSSEWYVSVFMNSFTLPLTVMCKTEEEMIKVLGSLEKTIGIVVTYD